MLKYVLPMCMVLASCGKTNEKAPAVGAVDETSNVTAEASTEAEKPFKRSTLAIPKKFIGIWDESQDSCAKPDGESDTRVNVSAKAIQWWETKMTVGSVEGDGRHLTVAGSSAGEGEAWSDRIKMFLSPDNKTITIKDVRKVRCGAKMPKSATPDQWTSAQLNAITNWKRLNETCRGGSGDDPATDIACEEREAASDKMKAEGVCYGKQDQFGYQMEIHRCGRDSL